MLGALDRGSGLGGSSISAMALLCDLSPVPAPLWAFASLSTKEGDWLSYENSL